MTSESFQVLIEVHNEYRSQARWLEDRRENTSKMIIAANFVMLGFVASSKFDIYTLAISPTIFILAHLGQWFSTKYFILSERDYARARVLRGKIDELMSPDERILATAFSEAEKDENQNIWDDYGVEYIARVKASSLHVKWLQIHKLFKWLSMLVSILILFNWVTSTYFNSSSSLQSTAPFPPCCNCQLQSP